MNIRIVASCGLFNVLLLGLGMVGLAYISTGSASARENLQGIWFDDTGRGAVELKLCGSKKKSLCGYIVWLKEQTDRSGRPLTDAYNPKPKYRKRPICGLQIIGRLKPQPDRTWDKGWIYDPKQGKSFDVALSRAGADKLKVTGYLGIKLFSESFIWRRAPDDIQRCAPKPTLASEG